MYKLIQFNKQFCLWNYVCINNFGTYIVIIIIIIIIIVINNKVSFRHTLGKAEGRNASMCRGFTIECLLRWPECE